MKKKPQKVKKVQFSATPIGKRVLLLPVILEEPENKSSALGIYLPESEQKDRPRYARVVEVGTKVEFLKKGDYVFYSDFGNEELTLNGQLYLIALEDSLYCTIHTK